MGVQALPRVVHAVQTACARASSAEETFEVADYEVGKAIPHDGSNWFGFDPATLLAVPPTRIDGLGEGYCLKYWHDEFHEPDAMLFRDLARQDVPAGALRVATAERPMRSTRYREIMQPQGYDDELRGVFRSSGSTWGAVGLYRDKGRRPFDENEVAILGALSSVIGAALRVKAALAPPDGSPLTSPGLLVFDADGVLISANDEATEWLDEICGPRTPDATAWIELLALPGMFDSKLPFYSLLAKARAVAAGYESGQARVRLRDRAGRWTVLHASCLHDGTARGPVAVVVEQAKGPDIAPIIIEAYGLSARERDVVLAVARGLSTPEIAAELFLSPHTVRDYIKAVFEKVDVRSRGELVFKLFAEHYWDALHEGPVVHVS